MSACRRTTTPTSWLARSCGRSGRRRGPPPAHGLDYERGHGYVKQPVEYIDDVVLAEIDDAQRDGKGPRDESHGKPSISAPCVESGQRGERSVKRWEGGELVRVEVRVKRRHPVVRAP